ncbi:MAG: hypothetical protein V8T87_14635 [Victivallales bacterium]
MPICPGKTIAEALKQLGMQPEDFCVDLMAKDAPGTMAAFAGMSENNLKRILAEEWVCCGTDESARPFDESIGRSHPRGFGSFPEFMKRVAAESGMSEAVRRRHVTSGIRLFAERSRHRQRGRICRSRFV